MLEIDKYKILDLFTKYGVQGFINISQTNFKSLEYSPLHDELSFENTSEIQTTLTIIKNHKKSVYKIDGYSLDLLEEAIQNMITVIEFGQYDIDIVLPEDNDEIYKDFSESHLENITFDDMEKEFQILKNYPFKKHIAIESFSIGVDRSIDTFINSFGAMKTQKDASSFYYVDIFGEISGQRDNQFEYVSLPYFSHISRKNVEKLEKSLGDKLLPNKKKMLPGLYTITLDKNVVIDFLEIILGNLNAESIREGMSLFSGLKLGQQVFDKKITLINNPDLPGYTGNMLFDREGVLAKKTILFENGVWKSKICDYKNALKESMSFLGNSTLSNIELQGQTSSHYLDASSFLFTQLMAFHTVDETTGKFSLNGEGYRIENGEKKDFVKNISLSGDILSLFQNIVCIGDDFKTDGNFKVPSITFQNQKII